MLDLRLPRAPSSPSIGVILLATAVLAPDARADLTEANVNLYCGTAMLAFGGLMLALVWRGRS